MQTLRINIFVKILLIGVLLCLSLVGCKVMPDDGTTVLQGTEEPQLPEPKTLTDPDEITINAAIQAAAAGREDVMAFIVYEITLDHVDYTDDKQTAVAWASMLDKDTGLVQNAEPMMVILHATGDPSNPWTVIFQADSTFAQELQALPDTLVSQEAKEHYMPAEQQESKDGTVYTGYHLPWANGKTVYLTGSIGHVLTYKSCPSTCLYAFDFANGSQFEIHAAKHGYVKYVEWEYADGNTTNANYIVLEDPSTSPTTYQVYYHLAQNSVPSALRVVGTEVVQGQYLGNADDTGYSSGNHLHFHVHTNASSVWGNSVDITFSEVSVNGGRPRTCAEAAAYPAYGSECVSGNKYVSSNADTETPTASITSPEAYSTVTSSTLNVSGTMSDDSGVESGQLYFNDGGSWTAIGDTLTSSPFTESIDLCDAGISDGTFFLMVEVTDEAGKVSVDNQGLTELTKSYTCPADPPACSPGDNQVALYTESDYQGTCEEFDIGEYSNLGSLSTSFLDNVRSVEVGSGTTLLLYPDADFSGTYELFQDGDSNLADNSIGAYNAASMKVLSRVTTPVVPTLTLPDSITDNDDLTLSWTVTSGEETSSTLTGPNDYSNSLDWQEGGSWNIGLLAAGDYTWVVQARNLVGTVTVTQEFTVTEAATLPESYLNDLADVTNSTAVKLTWEVDSGEDNIDHFELQYRIPDGDWTDYAEQPGADERELIFWGSPDTTVEFRIRAVDASGNAEDYYSVAETSTYFMASCDVDEYEGSDSGDDVSSGAVTMSEGESQTHNWCAPSSRNDGGQYDSADWITFTATSGDELQFTTSPSGLASAAMLTLYDGDGATFIGEAGPSNSEASASLDWTVPSDGTYYLKLTPADSQIRGTDTQYTVGIDVKSQVNPTTLVCGSATIPALLAGGYAVSKQVKKTKKSRERKIMGR